MKKLNPANVIGNAIINDNFISTESHRQVPDTKLDGLFKLSPIDTAKFGEYFSKITGDLNSILKKADYEKGNSQMVVKKRIGFRKSNGTNAYGNAKYATPNQSFAILHKSHIDLVCKRTKRAMVKDFCDIKENAIVRFHMLKSTAMDFVPEQIPISDAFTIGHKRPKDGAYNYNELGHVILNPRVIDKKDILISVTGVGNMYSPHETSIYSRNDHYNYGRNAECSSMTLTCGIARNEETGEEAKTLFSVVLHGSVYPNPKMRLDIFDTKFDGINITEMFNAVVNEANNLRDIFDAELEVVKEKYIGEFLLSEICDSDGSAI